MKAKRKLPVFYIVLLSVWIVALVALAIGLAVLRTYLVDFERAQPKYVAEEVFGEYFLKSDFEGILKKSDKERSPFEDDALLSEYLSSLVEGKELSYHNVSSGMDSSQSKYIVKYSEGDGYVKVASFTLQKSGMKTPKGFAKYELSGFELFYPADVKISIKAQKGSEVKVNGVTLDESYITEKNLQHASCAHMPEGVEGIMYDLYTVEGLVAYPEITATANDGSELSVKNVSEGAYETEIAYSASLMDEQSEFAVAAAQAFASYMQNDLKLAKLNNYFEKGTSLYNSIKSTLQWAVIDHDSFHFEDVETSEFYAYDENTFSCRVNMVHVLKRGRLEDYRDQMDVVLYLRKVNGGYLVYDMTNN